MKTKLLVLILAIILVSSLVSATDFNNIIVSRFKLYETNVPYLDATNFVNFTANIGTPDRTTGILALNYSQDFEDADQDIIYNKTEAYNGMTTNLTVSFWMKTESFVTDSWVLGTRTRNAAGTFSGGWGFAESGGKLGFFVSKGTPDTHDTWLTTTSISNGKWYHVVATFNGDTAIYLNGTLDGSETVEATSVVYYNAGEQYITIGDRRYSTGFLSVVIPAAYYSFDGQIADLVIWNYTMSAIQVQELFNKYSNSTDPFTSTPEANFSVTATNDWGGGSLNISVWVDEIFQYTNTTVSTTLLQGDTSLHNITIGSTNYFNRTYLNQNVGSNLAGGLHQAEVCFNTTAKASNASVVPNNFSINGAVRTSCFNISAGTYSVQANKTSWYSQNQTVVISALQNNTVTVQNMSYANLTISAKDGTTNASLTTCDSTIKSLNWTAWPGESQTGTFNDSYYLVNGTYNVTINCSGYALDYTVANVTVAGSTNYTFTLYKSNSVTITIRDEITLAPITANITIRWSDNTTTWENVTTTSGLFIYNLTASNYNLLFYGANYSTRTYSISVGSQTAQFLTAYMIGSTYATIMTVKDKDTGDVISDVSITMFKLVGGSWTTVESKFSDITGKAQFFYDPIGRYKFYLAKTEYDDYVFFLNPILFSTYDIFMQKSTTLNYSVDFDSISVIYAPSSFNNKANTTFNWLISNPTGELTAYSIRLTYPGGNCSASGVNAIGSQLSCGVNITGATAFDYVLLEYNYTSTISGLRQFSTTLPIIVNSTAQTWMSNKDKTYGLGIFERMLIATIIVIFTVGVGTLVGQVIPGMFLGLFVFGFLSFMGFIPLWGILPSMLVGFFFLIWKSGGY